MPVPIYFPLEMTIFYHELTRSTCATDAGYKIHVDINICGCRKKDFSSI